MRTRDVDVLSDDPARVEAFRRRVLRDHARDEGWAVADTVVTVDAVRNAECGWQAISRQPPACTPLR